MGTPYSSSLHTEVDSECLQDNLLLRVELTKSSTCCLSGFAMRPHLPQLLLVNAEYGRGSLVLGNSCLTGLLWWATFIRHLISPTQAFFELCCSLEFFLPNHSFLLSPLSQGLDQHASLKAIPNYFCSLLTSVTLFFMGDSSKSASWRTQADTDI